MPPNQILDDVLEAWEIHDEINHSILRWIRPEHLEAAALLETGKPSRGDNVAQGPAGSG